MWPKSTSLSTTPAFEELKDIVYGVRDAGTLTVINQEPFAGTVKGLGETAPAGKPRTVMVSLGTPAPHTTAGVLPPLQGSLLASTMWLAKTPGNGPHAGAAPRTKTHSVAKMGIIIEGGA